MVDTTKREDTGRDKEERSQQMYVPPSVLPFPAPEPGVVFRYIATHVMGQADPSNVSKRYREGWVPCKAKDYPELRIGQNAEGNVEVGGLMLCKMAAEQAKQRDAYYQAQAAAQIESVDNHYMKQNDPRMPLFKDKTSSVTRGRGFGTGTK